MAFRQICDDPIFEVDETPPTKSVVEESVEPMSSDSAGGLSSPVFQITECGEHLGSGDAVVTEMDRTRRLTFGTDVASDPNS